MVHRLMLRYLVSSLAQKCKLGLLKKQKVNYLEKQFSDKHQILILEH
jgi:hypothetical protein